MKAKNIAVALTLILSFFAAASAKAQGRVNFSNGSATAIQISDVWFQYDWDAQEWIKHGSVTNVLGTASTATFGFGPASAQIRLFAGLTSVALSPVLIGSGADQPFVSNSASTVAGAQGLFSGGSNLALTGFDGGQPVYLQFNVSVPNSMEYTSKIIRVDLATGGAPATQLFSATPTANQWGGILLGYPELFVEIPEPSSLSLLGCGCAAMLIARRKK